MREATSTLRCLVVGGSAAAAGLEEAGVRADRSASDVHEALWILAQDGPRPVLVEAGLLEARPRAAIRALTRAARPRPVVTFLAPGSSVPPRVGRAALSFGVAQVSAPEELLEALGDSRPPNPDSPEPVATDPPGAPSRQAKEPRRAAPRGAAALAEQETAFVDGCFRRLDQPDALCRFVLQRFRRATGAGRISLMLFDATRTGLFVKAARGLDPAHVGRARLSLASGVAGRAASLGRAQAGRATAGGPRGYEGTAYVVLPLGRGEQCEGVACLTDLPEDRLPDEALLSRLLRMGQRAGRALSASRRLESAELQSSTDELTGLPNRRAFERALARELELARRSGVALAVGLVDVDFFKRVNDVHGHPVGDRVLAQVARRLASALRETDLVCRWGGEEFAVLLTGLAEGTPTEALSVLERARRSVGERPLALGPGLPCPMVTVSAGIAVFPKDGTDGATLLERADQALYGAKHEGRDRAKHA